MHELAAVWTERKGLLWIAVTAFLYALILIPFNQSGWTIAGISIRPAAALPVLLGILFGPAAAWGLALGNIAGDFYGSWSPMSIFGALTNFLLPYLSYLLWHRLMKGNDARVDKKSTGIFLLVSFVAILACMVLLATCGTVFFGRPFESKFISYFGNNILWAMTVGTVLFWLAFEPAIRKGLVYGSEWVKKSNAT
ncbi:MAG: QueT transporter family protein [Methanolinea sp.]|jgi:energy-coupling factor transport system substrate-specific component